MSEIDRKAWRRVNGLFRKMMDATPEALDIIEAVLDVKDKPCPTCEGKKVVRGEVAGWKGSPTCLGSGKATD